MSIGDHKCHKGCRTCSLLVSLPKIKCVDDTVWAEKVQVWLTPDQLEQLFDMIKEREQMLDRKWKDALRSLGEAPTKKLKE